MGCNIRKMYFNSFMYADDLILLSISVCDLQNMVNLCKLEFDWLDMRINVKKSMCLGIGNRFKCGIGNRFKFLEYFH